MISCSDASNPIFSVRATSANPHPFFFSFVFALQPHLLLCAPPVQTLTLPFLFSRASTPPLTMCSPSENPQPFFFSLVLALQTQPFLCVHPAQSPILFFVLFLRFNPIPFFVSLQRKPPGFLLFSCSLASNPPLSLCADCANANPLFFSLALRLQPYQFLCVHAALTLTFSSFLLFPCFNLNPFLILCPHHQTVTFLLFSCSDALNPINSVCAPSAKPRPFFFSLVLALQPHLFLCVPPA